MFTISPARSATVLFALVWALAVPAAGQVISDVGAIPSPFSPNGDGDFDEIAAFYTLSEETNVMVSVADVYGVGIDTLWSGREAAGSHDEHRWDGWHGGAPVPDGDYQFILVAIPDTLPYEEVSVPFAVDTEPVPLLSLEVTPNRFSPDGDGFSESLISPSGVWLLASTTEIVSPGSVRSSRMFSTKKGLPSQRCQRLKYQGGMLQIIIGCRSRKEARPAAVVRTSSTARNSPQKSFGRT